MTEEIFKTLGTSIPSTKDVDTISTSQKQMVIVDPDGVAFLRQLLENLGSQNIIILQDDIEQEARKEILRNDKYLNIVINLLDQHQKELGIFTITNEGISSNFKAKWGEIFESQNSSFSNSISHFCKDILKSTKEESNLKKFIDATFWPEWANAVTLDCINKEKNNIIVLAPKVAGNSDSLKALATTDTSFSCLYTGDTPDTPSISYLMKEYTNKAGVTGPFALTSGKFTNHENKFFQIVKSKNIKDIKGTENINELLKYLNKDENKELKEEVMKEFQTYLTGIVAGRIKAIKPAIEEAGIVARQLTITDLPELSPKYKNVLTEGVKNTLLSETQTQTLGR